MTIKADRACTEPNGACASLPELVRMNYFHGQLIGERDLRTDQDYFRARLRHANRCLHGYGVLCGLELQPVPDLRDCPPRDEARREWLDLEIAKYEQMIEALRQDRGDASEGDIDVLEFQLEALKREREAGPTADGDRAHRPKHIVSLACGVAIDCEGNDIIVRQRVPVDLDALLACAPDQAGNDSADTDDETAPAEDADPREAGFQVTGSRRRARYAWLSICYRECGREPTRPFELDECATSIRCHDARVAEGWRLTASWQRPEQDERCELCCTPCKDACLLLARIRIDPAKPLGPGDIDHAVRRRFGLYEPAVITGINWRHGFDYSFATAHGLLGSTDPTGGLEIHFSRPVRRGSLTPGVVDLWRITGGRGGSGGLINMEAELIGLPDDPDAMVDRIRIRNGSQERVQSRDRVYLVVRTAFILDACCRPVDGAHFGGRLPRLADDSAAGEAALEEEGRVEPSEACAHPPHGPVPWTTGAGGNFESWFYISDS